MPKIVEMIFDYIVWNVDPELFHIGNLTVRWYGVLFATAFIVSYYIFAKFYKEVNIPLEKLDKLTFYVAIGTIIGARLGHVCFYEPGYYCSHPSEIWKIWHGGLASHGAAIGILIAIWLYSIKFEKTFWWLMDRTSIVVAISGVFIRTGNLMNSEIVGSPTKLPWAFAFVRDNFERGLPADFTRHPSQIYEALGYFTIFVILYWLYQKKPRLKEQEGYLFGLFLILLFGFRFFVEFFKDVQVPFEQHLPLDLGQLLSIPFVLAGIYIMYWAKKKQTAK